MPKVSMTVNGNAVSADAEPRMQSVGRCSRPIGSASLETPVKDKSEVCAPTGRRAKGKGGA